ncbi:hypothetical protein COOONC_28648 [Cooperia oncophora]
MRLLNVITNNIVISASSQTFHLKAGNDVDRQKWLSALEYSRHKAIRQAESDEDEDAHIGTGESRVAVLQKTHKELLRKLDDLQTAARILGQWYICCIDFPPCSEFYGYISSVRTNGLENLSSNLGTREPFIDKHG